MKKVIIKNNIILLLCVFLLFFALFFYALIYYRNHEQKAYMAYLIEEVKLSYEQANLTPTLFVDQYEGDLERRITVLDEFGIVIADTHSDVIGTDKSGRPEIKDLGSIHTRKSATIDVDLIYIATLLDDGNILRVSIELEPLSTLYFRVILIFIIGGTVLMSTYYLGLMKINKNLLQPWYQVRKGLIALNQGHYQMMPLTNPYDEINEIMHEMNIINIETSKNLNQITAYQLQLDKILNEMKQGVILINKRDEIVYYNDDAKHLFDLSDQAINQKAYKYIRFHLINESIAKANETNVTSTFDITVSSKVIEVKVFPILSSQVKYQNSTVLIILKDVSQERVIEQMKKDFFSHASHELKSPLTAIKGHAELIMHGIVKEEDIKKSTEQIIKQTETMALLVEDMLMLSRLENLKEKAYQKHDLSKILSGVIEQLKPFAKTKKIKLNVESNDIVYDCDELDIQKLFKNLVENAIKYSDHDKEVWVKLYENNDQKIVFSVEDQGFGISLEHQQRVFERFYRIDKGRLDGGTGLGLAIVKHIVMKYEGQIDLQSSLLKGTTIKITL